jgi:hypothetical protein
MTMRQDSTGRPFLYVASKEGGLRVYEVTARPRLVATLPRTALAGLDVMSLSQAGSRLFLALGNHFSSQQSPGLAVVDVSDPAAPRVLDLWQDPGARGGSGAVESSGSSVYLAAMGNGLIVFRLSSGGELRLVSRFIPSLEYPGDPAPNPRMYNVRGLAVRGGLVYVAYDAGGLRVVDVRDPARPVEIGRYANPALAGKPRAYNDLVLDGRLAYVTVDYCGVEVLDVSHPSAIRLISWWNPWSCQTSPFNWFSSDGHANEIVYDRTCRLLFVASGKSELQVLGVTRWGELQLRGEFGDVEDDRGTWGVSRSDDRVYLSYVCTLGIPFVSRWSGVKVLAYDHRGCRGLPRRTTSAEERRP